jgi:hypothetical protein
MNTAIDPTRCPLCGGPNGCPMTGAPAPGAVPQACWCTQASFAPGLLDRVPENARRKACICAHCAAAGAADVARPEPR